jgi:hypothetical protein
MSLASLASCSSGVRAAIEGARCPHRGGVGCCSTWLASAAAAATPLRWLLLLLLLLLLPLRRQRRWLSLSWRAPRSRALSTWR